MADSQDNAQRPRPFVPSAPPFRGPATAARPAATPLTPPDTKRPPAPFIARRESRPSATTAEPAPAPRIAAAPKPVSPDPHRTPDFIREAVAASASKAPSVPQGATTGDGHLYGRDPLSGPPGARPSATAVPSRAVPGEDAAPEEAAQALAGLPYFDEGGGAHTAEEPESARKRTPGKVHRVEQDPAAVLESLALRVRSGGLMVSGLDAGASDAATLAAVLAALLRDPR